MVRRILNDAMAGNPREFKRFLDLMERAGLFRREAAQSRGPIIVKTRPSAVSDTPELSAPNKNS